MLNLQLFATQEELEKKARTNTSQKTFAQDVKDRMKAGKSYEQAIGEAKSGREVSYETLDGVEVPRYGAVRSGGSLEKTPTLEDLQRQLLERQKEAQISALRGVREGSLAALQRQQSQVEPAFLKQRTGLRTQEQQLGRQTAEQLAAQGLSRSGAQAQSDLARRLQLQQGLTQSAEQEAGVLSDIEASRADVERQFQTGVAQAEAGAETAAIQQQLANIQAQRQADIQAQQLQSERDWEVEKMRQQGIIDEQMTRLDAELKEALAAGDLANAIELEKEKSKLEQDEIRLKAQLDASGGGTSSETLNQMVSDAIKGLENIEQLYSGQPRSVIENQKLDYIAQLKAQGLPDNEVRRLLWSAGLTDVDTGGDTSIIGGQWQ